MRSPLFEHVVEPLQTLLGILNVSSPVPRSLLEALEMISPTFITSTYMIFKISGKTPRKGIPE